MSVRTYVILGNEYDAPKVKVPKHKDAPIFTEQRGLAIADAMDHADLERIHAEAEEAAARIMRDWEGRTGR